MVAWSSLQDVYGPAARVPSLLASAARAGTDDSAVWDELWGRLCHQGTVASASYAALPALTDICRRREPTGYLPALQLAAAIVASIDGPESGTVVRQRYASEISTLRTIASQNLAHAADDTEFVYGLQALAAFEDAGVWQRSLSSLADGEVQLDCPSCTEALLLDLGGPPFLVGSSGDGDLPAGDVVAAEPAAETAEGGLVEEARAAGRMSVVERLAAVFGTATCPSCQTSFLIADGLL